MLPVNKICYEQIATLSVFRYTAVPVRRGVEDGALAGAWGSYVGLSVRNVALTAPTRYSISVKKEKQTKHCLQLSCAMYYVLQL